MTGHAMQCIQWGRCRDDFSQKPVHKVLARVSVAATGTYPLLKRWTEVNKCPHFSE